MMSEHHPQSGAVEHISVALHREIIRELADLAASEGHYGLQNVCSLLSDALDSIQTEHLAPELSSVLEIFPDLFEAYYANPGTAAHEIINILRDPGLAIELTDDEFVMLEAQLTSVDSVPHDLDLMSLSKVYDAEKQCQIMVQLAAKAEAASLFALQDACLLIAEALDQIPEANIASDLLSVLDIFPTLFNACARGSEIAAQEIINILRDPCLEIGLSDDEFAALELALATADAADSLNGEVVVESAREDAVDKVSTTTISQLADRATEADPSSEIAFSDEGIGLPEVDISASEANDMANEQNIAVPTDEINADAVLGSISQLADRAAETGQFALQDTCLLIAEALEHNQTNRQSAELLAALDTFPALFHQCTNGSDKAVQEIIAILRHPDLGIDLTDDEFADLAGQLAGSEQAEQQSLHSEPKPFDTPNLSDIILGLSEQAAEAGQFALQDVCLLIAEALETIQEVNLTGEMLGALKTFPTLFNECANGSAKAAQEITAILGHPDLGIGLADDELASLASQLSGQEAAEMENLSPAPAPFDAAKHSDSIMLLAEQAAETGQFVLQDACLLIAEALAQSQAVNLATELLAALDIFPALISECGNGSVAAAHEIANILRHPDLSIELSDEEFTDLANHLAGNAPDQAEAVTDSNEDLTAFADEAQTTLSLPASEASQPLSKATLELLGLLLMEAESVTQLLDCINLAESPDLTEKKLQQVEEELERYASASEVAGFKGLALICSHVGSNVLAFRSDAASFASEHLEVLHTWIGNVKVYLGQFSEDDAGLPMLAQLGASDWPVPLELDAASEILTQLKFATGNVGDDESAKRKQVAAPEDVSLTLPDDVNQELLDILLHELPVQTQQFSSSITNLQRGGNLADLETAQRVAHTIKGAANTVGIRGIAELTHCLEDILVACAENHTLPSGELLNVLLASADCLEGMTECVTGFGPPPEEALSVLQLVLTWANRIDQVGVNQIDAEWAAQAESIAPASGFGESAPLPEAAQELPPDAVEKPGAVMVRVAVEQMEDMFRQAGENIILNNQASERLRRTRVQLQGMHDQFELIRRLGDELEQLIDLKDLSGRSLVNIDTEFDALEMDQYNELHTASRRMVEAAFDAREMARDAGKDLDEMGRLLEEQHQVANETQEAVMKTRLVPVSSIVHRLQRGLRQACRLTGKDCDLTVSGEQLMVDGGILNTLVEPLMHLLRNSVDHGIESQDERFAVGKPKAGQIHIEFDREGNTVLVRCRDDGRGLDFPAIRSAAEKRGVVAPGQNVTEEELKRFILRPNFSTRSQTTQVSGRGVGMDVVHFQVLDLGGTLTLHSEAGVGLTVELRAPLPLSRSHALLVKAGPYRVAIISKGLKQILHPSAGEMITLEDGGQALVLNEITYPVQTLSDLLRIPDSRKSQKAAGAVLLVAEDDKTTAVPIDMVTGSLDVIIKGFGHYIKKIPGFAGAAILGDGSVAGVVDLPELLRYSGLDTEYNYHEAADTLETEQNLPTVLVVDDSLSQRRALEQLLTDVGFQIRSARDGMEAVEMLSHFRPDIVLTDMEMPRMNGIEMTAHIRAKSELKDLPIIMITSRSTQKHRKLAEDSGVNVYLTKPVREDDLLANMQNLMRQV